MLTLHDRLLSRTNNGIEEDLCDTGEYLGVPLAYYKERLQDVLEHASRFAPFWRIVDGKLIALDWQFYANSGAYEREMMDQCMHAMGVLTTVKLDSFFVRVEDDDERVMNPRSGWRTLYFSRQSYAERFAEEALPVMFGNDRGGFFAEFGTDELSRIEVVQCVRLPIYVTIRTLTS